jgi:hypothetical protein
MPTDDERRERLDFHPARLSNREYVPRRRLRRWQNAQRMLTARRSPSSESRAGTHPSRDSKVDVEPMLTEPPPTEVGPYFLSTEAMNFEAALNKSRQSKASHFRRDKYS